MRVITAAEMGTADDKSVEMGVPVATLMENAGTAVARFVEARFAGLHSVVVLCGKGNNGGDGMVAARKLAESDHAVRVVLLGEAKDLRGDPQAAWERAAHEVDCVEVSDEDSLRDALADTSLVIDAVVGTGFKPPLRGLAMTARDVLRELAVPVVAVDLPSGWDADSTGQTNDEAFRADAVVTFATPKFAHVFGALTRDDIFSPLVVAPIGTPDGALKSDTRLHWTGAAKAIAEKPRGANGNKGKFGHVLIIGGAFGKAGAPSMASLASMRTGAGLTTCAVPKEIVPTVAAIAPELMLTPLEEGQSGLSLDNLRPEKLEALLKGKTVLAIGPGLGTEGTTPEFVKQLLQHVELPMVIDADALNALAGYTDLLKQAAREKGRTIVLTPHPGEMARLIGGTVKDVESDRIGLARKFATEHGVTLVLKGWRTLVAHPDGHIGVNTTGNPAMAKGGSGDILTGIVAAMLAQYGDVKQGGDVAQAVEAAVFLHGLAGDFACLAQDEHTVLATDTVAYLRDAFKLRVTDSNGFTWIQGGAAR